MYTSSNPAGQRVHAAAAAIRAEDTRPSMGENHPTSLAFHNINNAAQIILLEKLKVELDEYSEERDREIGVALSRSAELLAFAGENVTALQELLARQERVIEEQRVENVRLSRTLERLEATDTRNKQQMAQAQHTAEELVRDLAGLVDRSTDLFNRARGIRLYDAVPRPLGATPQEPRAVAAGGQ